MRPNILDFPCLDMLFDHLPVLAVEPESIKEELVFFLGPPPLVDSCSRAFWLFLGSENDHSLGYFKFRISLYKSWAIFLLRFCHWRQLFWRRIEGLFELKPTIGALFTEVSLESIYHEARMFVEVVSIDLLVKPPLAALQSDGLPLQLFA